MISGKGPKRSADMPQRSRDGYAESPGRTEPGRKAAQRAPCLLIFSRATLARAGVGTDPDGAARTWNAESTGELPGLRRAGPSTPLDDSRETIQDFWDYLPTASCTGWLQVRPTVTPPGEPNPGGGEVGRETLGGCAGSLRAARLPRPMSMYSNHYAVGAGLRRPGPRSHRHRRRTRRGALQPLGKR